MRNYYITLKFDSSLYGEKDIRNGLSAIAKTGDYLWLACDETPHIERLKKKTPELYTTHTSFKVSDFIHLPESKGEIDIEGMEFYGHYLWFTGSHSLKRKKVRLGTDEDAKEIGRLAKVVAEPNRYVIGRIPLVKDSQSGEFILHQSYPNPEHQSRLLSASMLNLTDTGNELTDALRKDEHLAPFLTIAGKDNGFDIEGLAIYNERIFLGLRGPVLRGWAIILEIEVEPEKNEDFFRLKTIDGKKFQKHFLHLGGMGIRELCVQGNDMLILAGATMDIDATIAVFRWKNAFLHDANTLVQPQDIERLFDVSHGIGLDTNKNKAEGICILNKSELLVVYDSPSEMRKVGAEEVVADVFGI